MTKPVTFRPRARRDLLEQMIYLSERASDEMAERYYDAVVATCRRLAENPLSGASVASGTIRLRACDALR